MTLKTIFLTNTRVGLWCGLGTLMGTTNDLAEVVQFIFKNNFFEFNGKIKQQESGTASGTIFAPAHACLLMDDFENNFFNKHKGRPLVWFRYIDGLFFIWTHGKEKSKVFMKDLNSRHFNIKFTYTTREKMF